MDKLLCAENVRKSYKDKVVLEGLNLTLEPGKIYGLIGRNGVGKTTLLGILTAQNTLDSGSVTYGGEPVWENRKALDELCFSRELNASGAYGQTNYRVDYFLKAAGDFYPRWDKDYAEELLRIFSLDRKKKLGLLSKGQQSMVTIIIALASRAPVTILDEPVAGLDVVMREKFYQLLLADHMATGRTFVVSTHIIEEAAGVFEEVIILDDGRIIEKAPTEELLAQFAYISGREDQVDKATRGLTVLGVHQMGMHKTAAVRGITDYFTTDADVDVVPMNLQKVFVTLCGHGEEL